VLQLPEPEQFDKLIETIETAGSEFSKDCAMKVYGLLRRTHSQEVAQRVTFGTNAIPENVTPLAAVATH
jgi:hypothetical protein